MVKMERILFDFDEFDAVHKKSDSQLIAQLFQSVFYHRGHLKLDLPVLNPASELEQCETTVLLMDSCGAKLQFWVPNTYLATVFLFRKLKSNNIILK
jgi:hypothetical protein